MSADAQRAKIVAALNLSPLVPPQADNATLDIVNDAWMALSEMCQRQQRQDEEIERLHQESLDWQQAKSESDSACEDAEEREKQALIVAGNLGARVQQLEEALRRDPGQPWDVDISDYSDEWCAGFLAGQENAQDVFARSLDSGDGAVTDNSGAEIAQSFLDSGDGA